MADDPTPDPKPDPAPDPKPDPVDDPIKPEDDWQAKARKHERDLKKERTKSDGLAERIAELEASSQSDSDKAIADAKKEAKAEAKAESDAERRADRLDAAVVRLTAKGITVGTGDDAKAVKFADPDDVLAYLERAIEKGDIDADDLFDTDNKVQQEALTAALVDLAAAKPHWIAGDAKPGPGENDAGKGSGAAKTLAEQIAAAEKAGDAKELVHLKNQKLFTRPKV